MRNSNSNDRPTEARRPKVSQIGSPADVAARERAALIAASTPMYVHGHRIDRRNGRPLRAR